MVERPSGFDLPSMAPSQDYVCPECVPSSYIVPMPFTALACLDTTDSSSRVFRSENAIGSPEGPPLFMAGTDDLVDFEEVILPHLNAAYNLARWLLRSDQDAQDVVHDSFLRAHRYFASFEGGDGRAWLLGIVRNTCMTWLRNKRSAEPLTNLPEQRERSENLLADPEQALLLKENIASLRQCIEALPPEYREVVVMRELEELSYKQIADVAGLALGTVMSRLNRARKRLESCLAKALKEAAR